MAFGHPGSDALPGSRNRTRPTRGRHQSCVNTCGFLTCVAVSSVQKTQKREAHAPAHTHLPTASSFQNATREARGCPVPGYARLGQSSPGRNLWGDRREPPMPPPGRPHRAPLWEAGPPFAFCFTAGLRIYSDAQLGREAHLHRSPCLLLRQRGIYFS